MFYEIKILFDFSKSQWDEESKLVIMKCFENLGKNWVLLGLIWCFAIDHSTGNILPILFRQLKA